MNTKLLLGVAALAVSAGSAASQAAVVVTVGPSDAAVVSEPTIAIDIEGRINVYANDFTSFNTWLSLVGEIDARSASGWGFDFTGSGRLDFPVASTDNSIRGEIYHTVGEGRIGVFASTDIPIDFSSFGAFGRLIWGHISYEQETRYDITAMGWRFRSDNALTFNEGGHFEPTLYSRIAYDGVDTDLDVGAGATMRPNSIVYIRTHLWTSVLDGPSVWGDGTISLTLGDFKPYATGRFSWSPGNLFSSFTIGGQFEHAVAGGPLSLTAGGNVAFEPGTTPDGYAYIGIRFRRGELDTTGHLVEDEP